MIPPFDSDRQARELPEVAAIYAAFERDHGIGKMALHSHRLLCEALSAAGVELGAYDHRIVGWLAGWEPQTCAVIAGWVQRAAAARTARLSGADRAVIARARELADATSDDVMRAYFAAHDEHAADGPASYGYMYATALGIAQSQLDELLRIIARLDGAS